MIVGETQFKAFMSCNLWQDFSKVFHFFLNWVFVGFYDLEPQLEQKKKKKSKHFNTNKLSVLNLYNMKSLVFLNGIMTVRFIPFHQIDKNTETQTLKHHITTPPDQTG